jgi:hypothetical protein
MNFIPNLHIGTRLAIASGLGILLVAAMIYVQSTGGADVRTVNDVSAAQSLSSDSNRLKLEVGRFLNSVRAA